MTRQSKNYTRIIAARKRSAERKNGTPGPAQTTPVHGKQRERCAWYQKKMGIDPKKQGRGRPRREEEAVETEVLPLA